jgi:excinuclease ABC subunit A
MRRYKETDSDWMRGEIVKFMSYQPCPLCQGDRLKKESLFIKIDGKNIADLTRFSVEKLGAFFSKLDFSQKNTEIAGPIIKEIGARLNFLNNVGLSYLSLERKSHTLSGGEAQRIRLATQIGSALVGVTYVLDEPSIGLHQRDNDRLIETLKGLRDVGNTVIVVEHDEETILAADYVLDLGPRAGIHGGAVVYAGDVSGLFKAKESLTGAYLTGREKIITPSLRRVGQKKSLLLKGASENNLKKITVEFPLGKFICVTGVSGSGKSTLINDTLYPSLMRSLHGSRLRVGKNSGVNNLDLIDKVINIDQSPIGRTPRSNPATYTGLFTHIRDLFSELPESKARGYKPGRYSFNVKGGRCETCEGDGLIRIEMHFLPDVFVKCEACDGQRFNPETLSVYYKGKNIADILRLSVEDAIAFFKNIPSLLRKCETLMRVGLGYVELGQAATTLSGGEAQRIKLSRELSKRSTGKTLYILDEPTTGLHFEDVKCLLNVLGELVDSGNTVIVIEHNLHVVKTADHIIDLGPEGGDGGGQIVALGTPEVVAQNSQSFTGTYLKKILEMNQERLHPTGS